MANKPEMLLWLSDARGRYIPRDFANSFADRAKSVTGVSDEDWAILEAGPDVVDSDGQHVERYYWDTWTDVEQNAIVTDENGVKYRIRQDGDCWLIPIGMEWNDETESFDWPDERVSEDETD
jgi:hypothetical protein